MNPKYYVKFIRGYYKVLQFIMVMLGCMWIMERIERALD